MPLISCKHCGADAASSSRCPNCGGYSGNTTRMTILCLLLIPLIVIVGIAIGGKGGIFFDLIDWFR